MAELTFGIYYGGAPEDHHELSAGKPDLPEQVNRALDGLQGNKRLLVRTYLRYTGSPEDAVLAGMPSPAELARYTWRGRKLDLVLCNWDSRGNLAGWSAFIENTIARYGPYLQCLQICEEPNLYDYPGDGRFPCVVEAIVSGVPVAHRKLRAAGLSALVGFNAVPCFDPNDGFWRGIAQKMSPAFLRSLDYVGLNFYPDVTEPLTGSLREVVTSILTHFRHVNLAQAGIPASVPIHICENGWPTGPNRYYTRQADVLEQMVRTIHSLSEKLNITHYQLFALRDADTANPDPYRQFGILRDDYSPKPAFDTYRELIAELGA
ncbi:MAG TPA: hypothetical protein VGL97_08930 [Bryobacteraceae bacterium]|jgi:hypothetical protein